MDLREYESEWLKTENISKTPEKPTIATIKDEGTESEGKFGKQIIFHVVVEGSTVKWRASKTSIRNIIKVYGPESKEWIGKELKLVAIPVSIHGEVKQMVVVL